jgi:hypothetical protein
VGFKKKFLPSRTVRAAVVRGTNGVVMQQEFEASFTLFRYVTIADNGYTLIL